MLNVVCLMGRICGDLELRHTGNDVPVTSFTLAVDRPYKNKNGEKQTDFIDVVAWRGAAEFSAKYFSRGQLVAVQGAIQTRSYTDRDGNKRKAFEIVADNVHFAESKRENQNKSSYHASKAPDVDCEDDSNFDFSDDDCPF